MSSKKHKRKTVKNNSHEKKKTLSLLSRYPRLFIGVGVVLVLISILLLTVGYVSDAKIGVSMISFFFGGCFIIFANSTLPKKLKHD